MQQPHLPLSHNPLILYLKGPLCYYLFSSPSSPVVVSQEKDDISPFSRELSPSSPITSIGTHPTELHSFSMCHYTILFEQPSDTTCTFFDTRAVRFKFTNIYWHVFTKHLHMFNRTLLALSSKSFQKTYFQWRPITSRGQQMYILIQHRRLTSCPYKHLSLLLLLSRSWNNPLSSPAPPGQLGPVPVLLRYRSTLWFLKVSSFYYFFKITFSTIGIFLNLWHGPLQPETLFKAISSPSIWSFREQRRSRGCAAGASPCPVPRLKSTLHNLRKSLECCLSPFENHVKRFLGNLDTNVFVFAIYDSIG